MMNLNKVLLIGNLTRDPETRTTPGGQSVSSFGLATNRSWRDQQTGERKTAVEYHNIVAWGKLADICTQYLHKGSRIYTEGRLQTRSWDDQAGNKKYRTEIVLENMIMLDRKEDGNRGSDHPAVPAAEEPTTPASEEEISVEDIPF
ncbi:MAG: single-stranded DNA-binding protein [Patescibacteria group bacterium]|jgi:single-strand DNA-binding protein